MKTKFFSILITCFIIASAFSQANLNEYKYVIVPNKFDFLSQKDQYQLNSLTEFLFNKYGFQAVMEGGEYPEDLINNRCLALRSDVIKDSGMFKTKLNVVLMGCNDQVIYASRLGESRKKEFAKAYTEALRAAFKSFETINYKYEPKANKVAVSNTVPNVNIEVTEEIQKLREEIQTLKEEKKLDVIEVKETKPDVNLITKPEIIKVKEEKVVQKDNQEDVLSNILYAQVTEKGYQLVDNIPKVVLRILKTGANNVFLVENDTAIIYKEGDKWIYESVVNGSVQQKELNIKF